MAYHSRTGALKGSLLLLLCLLLGALEGPWGAPGGPRGALGAPEPQEVSETPKAPGAPEAPNRAPEGPKNQDAPKVLGGPKVPGAPEAPNASGASGALRSSSMLGRSESTAAVTLGGVDNTLPGGSLRNPAINQLLTVQDLARMQKDLTHMNRLIKELGMSFYLEQSRDMTFFMPVDEAFNALPFSIHQLSWQSKWRILQYHVIPNNVLDLKDLMRETDKLELDTWEGSVLTLSRVASLGAHADANSESSSSPRSARNNSLKRALQGGSGDVASADRAVKADANEAARAHQALKDEQKDAAKADFSFDYLLNDSARIISKPAKIETFNGAAYKINKVLLPPTLKEDDMQPARQEERINPEVASNLRGRTAERDISMQALEQMHASVDGTVDMERSAKDPKLPGSIRPDPLASKSQVTPDFVKAVNNQHSRWENAVYQRTPKHESKDQTKPQDQIMGFEETPGEERANSDVRIKVLGLKEGEVIPTQGDNAAMTRIKGDGPRQSRIGLSMESVESPDKIPTDDRVGFVDILLGGGRSITTTTPPPPSSSLSDRSNKDDRSASSSSSSSPLSSIFSLPLSPTERPKVKVLSLTEGLLPSEEILIDHWSKNREYNYTPNASSTSPQPSSSSSSHSPIHFLYNHMHNKH